MNAQKACEIRDAQKFRVGNAELGIRELGKREVIEDTPERKHSTSFQIKCSGVHGSQDQSNSDVLTKSEEVARRQLPGSSREPQENVY